MRKLSALAKTTKRLRTVGQAVGGRGQEREGRVGWDGGVQMGQEAASAANVVQQNALARKSAWRVLTPWLQLSSKDGAAAALVAAADSSSRRQENPPHCASFFSKYLFPCLSVPTSSAPGPCCTSVSLQQEERAEERNVWAGSGGQRAGGGWRGPPRRTAPRPPRRSGTLRAHTTAS